jgi:hypothetical protein
MLQIFTITEEGMTPLEAAGEASGYLSARFSDFSELSLGPGDGGPENPTSDAAELHYSYNSAETQGVRERIERVFTATDGDRYAVLGCAPAQEWPYQRQLMDAAAASLRSGRALKSPIPGCWGQEASPPIRTRAETGLVAFTWDGRSQGHQPGTLCDAETQSQEPTGDTEA